ncbi:MAG: alpha/beta hydrolase [Melioribacteraceae bacterium]|nr:alpha/beta hydrolase [Melioribacteraceae bacterium]MCF8264808.1 alpha/beta hydrolase [Melioribacteraceae bacterium]MCF8430351.1 alpha/beta hydrolase [Melioribacteraceae bacterium]
MKNLLLSLAGFLLSVNIYSQENFKIASGSAILDTWIYPKTNSETVILLHGGPGVPTPMDEIKLLLKDNYQVIYFHQRGVGESFVEDGNYQLDSYLNDITNIADYFSAEKFHLYGHSWGGLYAQIYSQENPNRILSLFLASPASGTGSQWDETEDEVLSFNESKTNFWQFVSMGYFSLVGMLGFDSGYQCLFKIVLNNYNFGFEVPEQDLSWMESIKSEPINKTRSILSNYDLLKDAQSVNFPVTITYGEKDIYGKSKKHVIDRFPNATVLEIPNSGHLPAIHNFEGFRKIFAAHFNIYDSFLSAKLTEQ